LAVERAGRLVGEDDVAAVLKVDLPEPEAPMMATNSPASIVRERPCRISTASASSSPP
jgi:hypothetical protein